MKVNLGLSHKALILVGIPFILELAIFWMLTSLMDQAEKAAANGAYFKTVTSETDSIVTDLYQIASTLVTYHVSMAATENNQFKELMSGLPIKLAHLRELTKNDPVQQAELDRIEPELGYVLKFIGEFKTTMDVGDTLKAFTSIQMWGNNIRGPFRHLMDDLHGLVKYQREKMGVDWQSEAKLRQTIRGLVVVAIMLSLLLAVGLAMMITRGITRRIESLRDNTIRLTTGETLLPAQKGQDEIAALDLCFHMMAEELAQAARKERAMLDNALDVICSLDRQGRFSKISPASVKVWGYEPDELLGQRFSQVVVAEDQESLMDKIKHSSASGAESNFENRVRLKNGSIANMLWSAQWVTSEQSLFCVVHDITDRKLAEELLRASEARIRSIIENMMVGIVMVTETGQIEAVNPRTVALFDASQEELVGLNLSDLLPDIPSTAEEPVVHYLKKNALGRIFETMAKRENGEKFPVETTMSEFDSVSGHRLLINLIDITERHEIERLKKEFVAMVSHDLRTPLTSVLGSLTLLSTGALGQLTTDGQTVVINSESEITRLVSLVNDLLDVAKMEAGKLDIHLGGATMKSIIDRSINAVSGLADRQGITIVVPPTEVEVVVDSERIIQVIVNLLSNALKFAPRDSVIDIAVKESQDWIEVRIKDHGPGIPRAFRETIFQRFKQVNPLDPVQRKGAGLGLAICKTIIEGHHGEIGVDSEEGRGSTFWFRIPVLITP